MLWENSICPKGGAGRRPSASSTPVSKSSLNKVSRPVSVSSPNGVSGCGPRRGLKLFGVEFAPLNTPLERRYQTLAAMMWFITLVFGGVIGWSMVAFLLFKTSWWHVTLLYLLWMYYDRETCETGGRWSEFARDLAWWKHFRNYFPLKLERTVALPADRNYLFCSYPHGVLCAGAFGVFATADPDLPKLFPGIKTNLITLSQHFQSPFIRELGYGLGGISSSSQAIRSVLKTPGGGRAAVLVVGGAAESLLSRPGKYHILLKCRKGFCKIALEEGSPLVPVFSFGEPELYDQVDNPRGSTMYKIQEALRKVIGIAPVIPIGRGLFQYSFGLIPRRRPVTVVVGKPIDVQKTLAPSRAQVDELHAKFTDALVDLFESNKERFHPGQNVQLIID